MKYIITCISSGLSKEINSNNYTKFNKILYFYASHPNYKITTGAVEWKIKKVLKRQKQILLKRLLEVNKQLQLLTKYY